MESLASWLKAIARRCGPRGRASPGDIHSQIVFGGEIISGNYGATAKSSFKIVPLFNYNMEQPRDPLGGQQGRGALPSLARGTGPGDSVGTQEHEGGEAQPGSAVLLRTAPIASGRKGGASPEQGDLHLRRGVGHVWLGWLLSHF